MRKLAGMPETRREKITRLTALLESGVTSISIDGESTSFDLETVRRELRRLQAEVGDRRKRSRILNINLSRR